MALLPSDAAGQRKLLVGLVPVLVLFAYQQLAHGKKVAQAEDLEDRLEALNVANNAAKILAAQGGPELERKLAIYEQHMRQLEELIPKREEVAELLHSITERAITTNVELTNMKPEANDPGPYYTRRITMLGVRGTYHSIASFLTEIGSLPRIVTPIDLKLVRAPANAKDRKGLPLIDANFRIVTYVIPELASLPADSGAAANGTN
jgi:type IV pilus assembly protein PilO